MPPGKKGDDARAEAKTMAKSPGLIEAISRDIAALGLVGETDSALTVYLAYSSRKLKKPLSVIIKGPSGSGKDEVQRTPAKLIPPEDVIEAHDLSPQSLYYGKKDWLTNKVVLGGERKHNDDPIQHDRTAAIRQMLSCGHITKRTVVDMKTKTITQKGPISYSETTTLDSIFNEDSNRAFQLTTNESPEQTRKVLLALGRRYQPGCTGEDNNRIKWRHYAFQESLKDADVRIPFAELLAEKLPINKIEFRRIFSHVLTLIEVITWLHQYQRKRDHGQLLATLDDYALARRLALGPLHIALGTSKDKDKYSAYLAKLPNDFNTSEAMKLLEASSRKVINAWLDRLADMGAVECISKGAGGAPSRWRKTGKDLDEFLLPSAASLGATR